jgi:cysteine-rich repeat protein
VSDCGDGVVAATEECDDGNGLFMDGCGASCDLEFGYECEGEPSVCHPICGDGSVVVGEPCDDGNTDAGDGCAPDCTVEDGYECSGTPSQCHGVCGNGSMTPDEECDDGNTVADDGCAADCTVEAGWTCAGSPSVCYGTCGDGVAVGNEPCDDGGESATCNDDCTVATCGDGKWNATAGEDCDDGGDSVDCDADCTDAECGDGDVNAVAGEGCDDGGMADGDGCAADCTPEAGYYCTGEPSNCTTQCGDGIMAGAEACDDGGDSFHCDADCTLAECGDGDVNAAHNEGCDDGGTVGGDGCAADCTPEAGYYCTGEPSVCNTNCGDGVVAGGEQCDDGGESATCDANCTVASCGDGTINTTAGEICDDGGTADGDGCDVDCLVELGYECTGEPSTCQVDCGDGIVFGGEECDDGGETAACDANCTFASCGDGDLNATAGETCDDGNTTSGDGCDATCQSEYVLYVDPVAGGHTVTFNGLTCMWCDDEYQDVNISFPFPYWSSNTTTSTTTTMGMSTNGALALGGGSTSCCSQTPLWDFFGTVSVIHAHGADGYVDTASRMYSYADATMAVFTWTNMAYCCTSPGNWGVQVILYPNGNFTIYQIAATTATTTTITIGLSDGLGTDNSVAGATNLDWDTQTIGVPFSVGQVDFGSSEAGGMAMGRFLFFEYNASTGYTCTVTQ